MSAAWDCARKVRWFRPVRACCTRRSRPRTAPRFSTASKEPLVSRLVCPTDVPFFQRQKKIVLENSGVIDPERIEDYIAANGYSALIKVLTEMTPREVIDEVTKSGLRGRGGAGYPTGLKWSTVSKSVGTQKYVICNADEGDPGAFMDRSVLESDPHRVLEGMPIAAYAVGASEGYIYVRAEYPLAIKRLRTAIRQAERLGLLGANICGTRFSFRIDLRLGAGAFVCGEETALIASVEGKRGTPRPRPPYPAQEGSVGPAHADQQRRDLRQHRAHHPQRRRLVCADRHREEQGHEGLRAGRPRARTPAWSKCRWESPCARSSSKSAAAFRTARKFKAVQTGGPSGGCLPAECLDMPVDYESLAKAGSIMGSGGMIVMDETSCMVDVAKYFMEFCMTESCGKCIPCRVGTVQMHRILTADQQHDRRPRRT